MANLSRLVACLFVLMSFNVFAVDTDGDGFSDADEATLGTDPNDPTSPLGNKLTASDGAYQDYFGNSVSTSGDTAIIGAWADDDNGADSGSVYVYVRENGIWTEQSKLTASDGAPGDRFGSSVSIDGDTAIIGAQYDGDGTVNNAWRSGSAYVFVRSNGVWTEQQKLTASDGSMEDHFGGSISLDGDTAVIGASYDDFYGVNSGSAYVFVRSNGMWSEQAKLTDSDGANYDLFGHSVSIDGDTVMIGAQGDGYNLIPTSNAYETGAVNVFVRSNGVWSEQQKLISSDRTAGDRFGRSVSIDGDTAVIGALLSYEVPGSAYVFVRSNGVWSEQQKLTASDGAAGNYFGFTVSLYGDKIIIGASGDNDNGGDSGSAYVYERSNGLWTEQQKLTASDGAAEDHFGFSVSIDGDTAVIGARGDNDNGGDSGSAYIFPLTPPSDSDGDGAYDHQDNCPSISNANQANFDGDTFGDACDNDKDGDGFTSDHDYNDFNAFFSTDPDGDGVDSSGESHYTNNVCLRAPNCNENDPCVTVCYVPPQDNCPTVSNSDQNDLDNDSLGNVCDSDADGDGLLFAVEDRLGGSDLDANDVSFVTSNVNTYFENAPADSDLDGVPDDVEAMLGEDNTTSTFQDLLDTLSSIATTKNVPAMGGIGLLTLGLSILGLGAVRLRKKL